MERAIQRHICLALLTTVLLWLQPTHGLAQRGPSADPEKKARAQKHYKVAINYHDLGQYERAIEEFLKAYQLYPNAEFFFLIAKSYHAAGKRDMALKHYKKYIAKMPNGRVIREARATVEAIQRQIEAEEEAARKKAEEEAARKRAAEEELKRKAERAAAQKRLEQDAALEERDWEADAKITTPKRGKPGRGLRIGGIATAGAGILAFGLAAKFRFDARAAQEDVEDQWDPERDSDGKAADRNQKIFLGIGTAAVIGAGVLYYLGLQKGRRGAQAREWALTPGVDATSASLTLRGSF